MAKLQEILKHINDAEIDPSLQCRRVSSAAVAAAAATAAAGGGDDRRADWRDWLL